MYTLQAPLFKELMPYSGKIDWKNRWVKMAKMVPWDEVEAVYRSYFAWEKQSVIKNGRLITGLLVGQMILKMSDRQIVGHFHENPYFQYFCGETIFIARLDKGVIHPSLLSKRRKRLGVEYMRAFEQEVQQLLCKHGVIKGKTLKLDATVFEAYITYPNDVKLLNTAREWCCDAILNVKNAVSPKQKVRTVRQTAKRVFLTFQKTRRKTEAFIRKTRNRMLRFLKRNIGQLERLLSSASQKGMMTTAMEKLALRLVSAKEIYRQQLHMATTRGKRISDRIVSFHHPAVRPMIRGKEGAYVEFGIKAHVALVDGYAMLDRAQFDAFHEGNLLPESLDHHQQRFGRLPDCVIADQLYATRANRALLKDLAIEHAFKPVGRPPDIPEKLAKAERQKRRSRQVSRNAIEGLFGHLKSRFNLHHTTWTVPDGAEFQVRLGLLAFNLSKAIATA